jgi:hypothetical protein
MGKQKMSSFDQGYQAGVQGMSKAIDTAHLIGAIQERKRIIALISVIKDNWQKPAAFNYQTELFKLIQLIEETK